MRATLLVIVALLSTPLAQASERVFAYTYETPVLPAGAMELEPWITAKVGRDTYYFRMDHRLELEWGLGKGLQTALYLNHRVQAVDDGSGGLVKESKFRGFSSEWKWSLSDPVADALGSALYVEVGVQPHEVELEAKLLLDKHLGRTIVAFNAVGEAELMPKPGGAMDSQYKAIALAGLSHPVSDHVYLGLELRQLQVIEEGEIHLAQLSAGPTLAARSERAWVALSVLPQVLDLASGTYDLEDTEAAEVRFIVGAHL